MAVDRWDHAVMLPEEYRARSVAFSHKLQMHQHLLYCWTQCTSALFAYEVILEAVKLHAKICLAKLSMHSKLTDSSV